VWRLPYVDLLLIALFVTLWFTKRREIASALVILSSPWIVVGVVYPLTLPYLHVNALNVVALVIWAIGIVSIVTTSRYRPQRPPSVELS
jgi:Na+/H+ antiporter NhaD/arsenite permease-like protein